MLLFDSPPPSCHLPFRHVDGAGDVRLAVIRREAQVDDHDVLFPVDHPGHLVRAGGEALKLGGEVRAGCVVKS
jgi:hypothetical protein